MSRALISLCLVFGLVGCGAPPSVHQAHEAQVALANGETERALRAAEAAEAQGGALFTGFRYFVRGNVAWAESLAWEAEPEGEVDAMRMAETKAEDALAYWQMAAASRPDWPAARRNVERGLRRLENLREQKAERPKPPETERTPDPEETAPENEDEPEESEALIETGELAADRIGGLLEVLLKREGRKRALRAEQRRARGQQVERDW